MREYFIRLTAVSIFTVILRKLAPSGESGRAIRLSTGIVILLVAFAPLAEADLVSAAQQVVRSGFSDLLSTRPVDLEANSLLEGLITQEAEAYILDKADAMGAEISARVSTKIEDRYPIPWSVQITGSVTGEQKNTLRQIIETDLGIPEERQEWWNM